MNPWSRPDSCSGMVLSFLLMLFLVVPISGQNFNLSTDLVAYYPLDLDAKDYSGNCLHGEVYGPTSTINRLDISGKALRFDGKDDFIEVPHSPLLNFTNEEDFAISLWVKLEEGQSDLDTTDNDILSKWVENDLSVEHLATGYPYTLRIINKKNNKKNYFYWAQFGGYNKKCKSEVDPHSKSAIENDAYFHICLNVKSNRFYFYVNGRLERMEGSSVICDPFNTAPMRIGKRGGPNHANHFRGVLDDLAIWGRALTEEEILKISEASFDFKHYLADLIEEQELVKSDTLFFDTDDWQLSKKQKRTISKYFTFLDLAEDYELLIAGHTNNLCEDAFCEELSMKRARIVKEYLHKLGYDCDGISAIGRGKSRQIAPNKYPSTRKLNQRVELGLYKLTKK